MAAALEAQSQGMSVQLIDAKLDAGASRNSAGLIDLKWFASKSIRAKYPQDWPEDVAESGLAWLEKYTQVTQPGEWFTNLSRNTQIFRPGLYLLPQMESFLDLVPACNKQVCSIAASGEGWEAHCFDGTVFTAKKAILAVGAWTEALLFSSGLPPISVAGLWGQALLLEGVLPVIPQTFLVRPRTSFTLRPWDGGNLSGLEIPEMSLKEVAWRGRLGNTSATTPRELRRPLEELVKLQEKVCPQAKVIKVFTGVRPVTPKFVMQVVAPGCVVVTGGHRVGLALAGPVAQTALNLL